MQFQIPCFPISERTTWSEWPSVIDAVLATYEEKTGSSPPLLLFVPCAEMRIPGLEPKLKLDHMQTPEHLVIFAAEPTIRDGVFQALDRVAAREPQRPDGPRKTTPTIKPNTPFKSIYRQMAEMPATVYSITFPLDDLETKAAALFFLRTVFTIQEFRREMEKPL